MAEKIVSFLVGKASIIHNGKGYIEGQTIPEMTLAQAKSLEHAKKGTMIDPDKPSAVDGDLDAKSTARTAAGGDLTGTYPSPTIADGSITSTHLADGSVTTAKIAGAPTDLAFTTEGQVSTEHAPRKRGRPSSTDAE